MLGFGADHLTGTDQYIYGANNFYNLTKNIAATDTLTFESGVAQTVAGALNLQGAASSPLYLYSTSSGRQWSIDPQNISELHNQKLRRRSIC
ncbi:MAG: hypothetical protein GY862_10740 [Gammaproteobacteria bacterium]|nr:hypothetical protein [Gammaproteobacteria bacterium]